MPNISSCFKRTGSALQNFGRANSGNVAITFALGLLAMSGAVGAALDYSRANSVKVSMQSALDATALMLAKEAGNLTASDLQTNGTKYFLTNFNRTGVNNLQVTVTATSGSSTILVNGSGSIDATIMQILGFKTLNIGGSATAIWGAKSLLRIALVLDNTGSMADAGKMTALQTATRNMLSKLNSAAKSNGDVLVSIIPFAKDVNLGASNYNAGWTDWTGWDAANSGGHNTWNGCVTDRGDTSGPSSGNYDTNVAAPTTGNAATLYAAEQYSSCPQAAMALGYNWTAMNSLVNNMTPNGNTNQGIGLQVGWMSLTQNAVINAPVKNSAYTYGEHIILLTDGLNTQNRWSTSQASIDARQAILCNNIKAAGITLWTIQVNTGGDPTSTLLQSCATDSGKFFLLTTATQIISTFDAISFKITQLHLSK
jgi:Flp pilus assembly protein TadG